MLAIFVRPYVAHPRKGYPKTPSELTLWKSRRAKSCARCSTDSRCAYRPTACSPSCRAAATSAKSAPDDSLASAIRSPSFVSLRRRRRHDARVIHQRVQSIVLRLERPRERAHRFKIRQIHEHDVHLRLRHRREHARLRPLASRFVPHRRDDPSSPAFAAAFAVSYPSPVFAPVITTTSSPRAPRVGPPRVASSPSSSRDARATSSPSSFHPSLPSRASRASRAASASRAPAHRARIARASRRVASRRAVLSPRRVALCFRRVASRRRRDAFSSHRARAAMSLPTHRARDLAGAHDGAVLAVRFSRDAAHCVTCGRDRAFALWNARKGDAAPSVPRRTRARGSRRVVRARRRANRHVRRRPRRVSVGRRHGGERATVERTRGRGKARTRRRCGGPGDALCASAGYDASVRLWDCRASGARAMQVMHARTGVAFGGQRDEPERGRGRGENRGGVRGRDARGRLI